MELIFSSTNEAIQHLADITGKRVKIAGNRTGPQDGTGPLSNTEQCQMSSTETDEQDTGEGNRTGPQDGTGPKGNTPACPLKNIEEDVNK